MARPEVTGRAPSISSQRRAILPPPTGPPIAKQAFTIPEFCARHSLSRAQYYKLKKQGKTPREMRDVGRIPLITIESETAWRAERMAATEALAKAS